MAGKAEYKNEWQRKNCDRVNLTMPKGEKQKLQDFAQSLGKSLNGFINEAIVEKIERESR